MKGKVGSVLFDAVGTLIRPYPSVGSVYARAAAPFGVRCSPRSLDGHFRQAYHELMPERFSGGRACRTSEARERRWWKKAVSRTFERAGCGRVPPAVTEAAFEAFAAGGAWRPYADAVPTLERLTALGCRLGLISNFDSRLRGVMKDLGLADFFDHLTISSESCRAKPSEKIFQQAVRALGTVPGKALYVGDREKEDYLAPRRAGLRALWLVRDGRRRGPHIIRGLDQVPSRLARL